MVFRLAGAAGAAGEACTRVVKRRFFSGERVPPAASRRSAAGDRAGASPDAPVLRGHADAPRRERHARVVPGERANGAVSGAPAAKELLFENTQLLIFFYRVFDYLEPAV